MAAHLLASASFAAEEAPRLTVMTLNLHGYHPMGEKARYLEDRQGRLRPASSDLYYFSLDELARGHARRAARLASDITRLGPDLVFLQEVGAGWPGGAGSPEVPKTCASFGDRSVQGPGRNAVLQIADRLGGRFTPLLACRGNAGWVTNGGTFADARAVRLKSGDDPGGSQVEVVQDFGANPVPDGLIVEGFGMLVASGWRVAKAETWTIDINAQGETMKAQAALVKRSPAFGDTTAVLAVNVHMGHKVQNFEQVVALRRRIDAAVANFGVRVAVVVAGDMNATLYRPALADYPDLGAVPWELNGAGFAFDSVAIDPGQRQRLTEALTRLNRDHTYKDWATIQDEGEAHARIDDAVSAFAGWQESHSAGGGVEDQRFVEAVSSAAAAGHCVPVAWGSARCDADRAIDQIFFSRELAVTNAFTLYADNDWQSLAGPSDHPAMVATLGPSDLPSW